MTTPGPFTARPLEDGVWIVVGRDDDQGDTHTVCRAEPCETHRDPDDPNKSRAQADAQAIAEALSLIDIATTFTICAHPNPASINYYSYAIEVTDRGDGRWAVCRMKRCLDADGEWDYEPIPSERTDEWLATHRFDRDTAIRLAREAAPKVKVNGIAAADAESAR